MITRSPLRCIGEQLPKCPRRHFTRSSPRFQQTSPSPKICVVPFAQQPQSAMERLQASGLVATHNVGNAFYGLLQSKFTGQWVHQLAKYFDWGKGVRMKEMKAVYYPIWRCDAVLEGTADLADGKRVSGWLNVTEAYVPGNSFAPLSYLSYAVPPLEQDLPTYDPSRDLKQLGDGFDITPVPFDASPLGLIKQLRKAEGQNVTWSDMESDISTWQERVLACYPIMYPLYIAQFEFDFPEKRSCTVMLDASDDYLNLCRVSFERPAFSYNPDAPGKSYFEILSRYTNSFMPKSQFALEIPIQSLVSNRPPPIHETIPDLYTNYMSPLSNSGTTIPPSPMVAVAQEESGIDWNDPRIQSWNQKDSARIDDYIQKMQELHIHEKQLEGFQSWQEHERKPDHEKSPDQMPPPMMKYLPNLDVEGTITRLKDVIENDKKEVDEAIPSWMKEWKETQGLETRLSKTPIEIKPKKGKTKTKSKA